MNPYTQLLSFFSLLKTAEFSRGLRFAGAALIPLMIAAALSEIQAGIAMAIGVLLTSPSDVPGSLRRRVIGIGFSIVIAVLATIITGFAVAKPLLFVPVLILQIFHFSMISVFGFRASLISFSGLLAVVLSMAQIAAQGTVLGHAAWIGLGGLWYLLFTLFVHYLFRRRETDELLAETFNLTASYLELRSRLMAPNCENREELEKELFELQTFLNEKHELIREMVITRRKNFGRSAMVRKRLLIFMEVVDILELGMSNPVNHSKMSQIFKEHKEKIELIQEWSRIMALHLRAVAQNLKTQKVKIGREELQKKREQIIQSFKELENSAIPSDKTEDLLILRNILVFKEKQYQKVISIEKLMKEWKGNEELNLRSKDAAGFLTTPDYNFKTLQDNIDFKSPIFRHSIRLSVIMIIGYMLGDFFEVQNAYWILLTIVVIMRPGYALTRDRFKQRLYGSLIGGGVAVLLVFLVRSQIFYGILAVICLVLAHSMIQRNYKTAAAFITLNVVFVYSLLRPNVLEVIQFRLIDTVVGASLAFFGAKFLWPTWEYSTIQNFIKASIKANREFFQEVGNFYNSQSNLPASYRLARKKAFLAMGDLNAAFQRMAQEPKLGEFNLEETFKLVSLNQEFLSATASLGTFIRSHAITKASPHFQSYLIAINENLKSSVDIDGEISETHSKEIREAENFYKNLFKELLELQQQEQVRKEVLREKLQEVQIITDRLNWLLEISRGLKRILRK